jgi:hypothetical protein
MHRLQQPKPRVSRLGLILVFVFMMAVTANAYTVVMRGGRRIEIPSRFVVTASTLTYEVSPGIQITLQVAAIDIPATEKVNNEPPGSLLKRAQVVSRESSTPSPKGIATAQATQTTRTITNRDLESSMRRRRQSELAYESRRKQLGLPSVEESRKQAALESELIGIELEQRRLVERESENYWRGRAEALRTEMAALDAELAYVRARIDEGPFALTNNAWVGGWSSGSFNTITRGVPFGNFGRRPLGYFGGRAAFPSPRASAPNIFVAPGAGAQISGRVGFGGRATRGQAFVNPAPTRHARPQGFGGRSPVFPNGVVFGSSIPAFDLSYERSALITHFNELAAARAGLSARWRQLEEEARRAGAPPGWLRP